MESFCTFFFLFLYFLVSLKYIVEWQSQLDLFNGQFCGHTDTVTCTDVTTSFHTKYFLM